jgi:prepilin-type N-terminal cleavage/methylation domain-containing protein
MMHRQLARDRGFTLVEMLITVVIAAIVMFGVFRVFTSTSRTYERGTENIDGQQNARAALTWLSKELRATKGFNLINPGEVTVLSDENVRNQSRTFRLDTTDRDGDGETNELLLIRNPNDDGTAGVYIDEIAVGIDSLAFVYRDGAGAVTGSRASVREVEVFVFASGSGMRDRAGAQGHGARQVGVSSRVKCRNLGKSVPTGGDVTPPAAPTGLSVTMGCGTATLQWSANTETDIAGYLLSYNLSTSGPPYGGTDAFQGPSPIFVGNATTYTLTGLSLTGTYYFNLQAVDAADNQSGFASQVSGVPSDATAPVAPTGLTGRVVGNAEIQLDWNAVPAWDVAWYVVRYFDETNPSNIRTDSTQAVSIVIGGLVQDALHTFTVSAKDACGNQSSPSSPFTITMVACSNDVTFPATPAGVAATPGDEFVQLTWSQVIDPDVIGYQIYFQENGSSNGMTINVGNVTTYSLYGLTNGTTYELQVAAVDGCGHVGGYSSLLPSTPQNCASNLTPPETPANVTARDLGVGDQVQLSWTVAGQGDVLGYKVYWGTSPTSYSNSVNVGNTVFHTVSGLVSGTVYYFTVTSYDVCGNESAGGAAVAATPSWGCACPPTVTTTSPSNVAVLQGLVSWNATAAACSTASIAHVEFVVDGTTAYVDYVDPYEFGDFGSGWDTTLETDGAHTLVSRVTDSNGCQDADTISVFLDNTGLGAACLGFRDSTEAYTSGMYSEVLNVTVTNQSLSSVYKLHALSLTWDDPTLTLLGVSIDGSTVWTTAGFPGAASGDSLHLSSSLDIPQGADVQLALSFWTVSGANPGATQLQGAAYTVTFFGWPVAVCGPQSIPMPKCFPVVTLVSENSSNPYDIYGVPAVGIRYYTDRTYTLTYLPNEILDSILARTPNADKNKGSSHSHVLSFDRPVTVWIAYDPRGTPPNWIKNNYTATGLTIGVTDPGTSTLALWKRNVAAGTLTFSGNQASGWGGGVATNYVIFVTCQ